MSKNDEENGKGTRVKLSGDVVKELEAQRQERENTPPDLDTLPDVLTVPEVAGLLRISRGAAYEAARRGKIPGVRRVGRSIRVSKRAVVDWLGQGCVSR